MRLAAGVVVFLTFAWGIFYVTGPDLPAVGRVRVRCDDFASRAAAQARLREFPYLDRDKDSVPCERLP